MDFFPYDQIKQSISCKQYLQAIGIKLGPGDRIAATWRGGTNESSVHIREDGWHDFSSGNGGSVIDLCAAIEFNGNLVAAQDRLGHLAGLTPRAVKWVDLNERSNKLTREGFKKVAEYCYTNEHNVVSYYIDRYEHPTKGKTFIHRTPHHEGLDKDTQKFLYNLPAVVKSPEVWIVEGEKDVETLRQCNIVATTNSGGALNWEDSYTPYLQGKELVIVCDNDEPGKKRGENLYNLLKGVAKDIKIITPSEMPKGDVTDYLSKEGGTIAKLREMTMAIKTCKEVPPEIAAAKIANGTDFANYEMVEGIDANGRKETRPVPRPINEMLADINRRFLGFPRVLGSKMFDYSREKKEIVMLDSADELFAWIKRISGRQVDWSRAQSMTSRGEFFQAVHQSARCYSGVSSVPHFPVRRDIFYTHKALPLPDPSHYNFWKLIDFFNPADATNRLLIAAMFLAPLYYEPTVERPIWIVDTEDAQASGKTTLVKLLAFLYGNAPTVLDLKDIENNLPNVMRRLVSSEGRKRRIALLDNVVESLRSKNLALLATLGDLTGIAPYGHNEETRPNDITYVITVNGAQVDTDIATRAYTVRIKAPGKYVATWETDVHTFIEVNRMQIFADMIHMIQTNALCMHRKSSRFGKFDTTIISAVCSSPEEFEAVDAALVNEATRANEDGDKAQEFMELFLEALRDSKIGEHRTLFVRGSDIDTLLDFSFGAVKRLKQRHIRAFVKQGLLPRFNKNIERFPTCAAYGHPQYRGFLYGNFEPGEKHSVQMLKRGPEGKFVNDGDPIVVTPRK